MKALKALSVIGAVSTYCLISTAALRAAEHDDKAGLFGILVKLEP